MKPNPTKNSTLVIRLTKTKLSEKQEGNRQAVRQWADRRCLSVACCDVAVSESEPGETFGGTKKTQTKEGHGSQVWGWKEGRGKFPWWDKCASLRSIECVNR